MSAGDELNAIQAALSSPAIFNGPWSLDPATGQFKSPPPNVSQCGAYIEAIFRPLTTCYKFPDSSAISNSDRIKAFDYLDPQWNLCSKTIPTGKSLQVLHYKSLSSTPLGEDGLITETWREFTIRRVMCPSVPWQTIAALTNRINQSAYTPAFCTILSGNNTFPARCLRYDGAEVVRRIMPTCTYDGTTIFAQDGIPTTAPMYWYDIVHKFSWRTLVNYWTDQDGNLHGPEPIGWNASWYSGGVTGGTNFWAGWYDAICGPAINLRENLAGRRMCLVFSNCRPRPYRPSTPFSS